jgi:ribonuclease G
MSKEMYISSSPHETKVAVLEDDQLVEVYFERDTDVGLVGGIYKGRVSRVLPGMQSAFVDIGLERDAFLYVSDFFYEDQEEYDKVFEEAEARATKFTAQQSGAATTPAAAPPSAPSAPLVTEPLPPVAAEAAPPVVAPPAVEPPAATVAPGPTPAAPAPFAAPPAPRESHDRRPFDRRGRRRRHRGRPEFGENRPGERRFPPAARPEETPTESHPFEILPGESLAKYRSAGSTPVEETETGLSEHPRSNVTQEGQLAPEHEAQVNDDLFDDGHEAAEDEAAAVEAVEMSTEAPPVPENVVGPAELVAEVAPETSPQQPRDEDTIVATDAAVPFTPGAIYSPRPSAVVESSPSQAAPLSIPVEPTLAAAPEGAPHPADSTGPVTKTETMAEAPPVPTSAAEVAPPSTPGEVAAPSSGEAQADEIAEIDQTEIAIAPDDSAGDAPESPSDRAELDVLEDEGEGEEEDFEEDEKLAVAFEGQLNDQIELPAGAEGETPAAAPEAIAGEAPAAGAPSDRTYTLREPHQRPRFAPRRRRGRRGPGGPDRGPRRFDKPRESSRPGGNHHPVQIAEVLKEGQEILVQIAKEPLGTKGARITSHVALPGRYLVYMPTIDHIGVSRKIASEEERLRLRNIILENKGALTGGFIVRTAGQGRSEEEFKADLKFLSTLWADIRSKSERMKAPALIHRDLDLVQRLLRDLLTPDFKCVRVDSEIDYERVLDFVNRCQPALVGKVKLYSRDTPLYEEFGIQAELDKALKPKVWLKSGGYIVINQTEALVAVDVNTGKYVGKTNRLEDTIVKTNVDAVNEIVRQVRLRDLGGIIVIDFIDMDERKNRAKVVQALEEALRSDRAPTKVISFNDFGLVAITRKRVKQSLERTLCVPCSYCAGSGWIKSVNTVCNEILAEARKMAKGIDGNVLTLRVNPEVAKALKSREGNLVSELESMTKKDVIIKSDPTVHQERFEIY